MKIGELLQRRLGNQRLVRSRFTTAGEVVAWLGAVQAQDYPAAKWGLSLRANGVGEAEIDRAFDKGDILRTHILRPTWHFVHRDDLRWMMVLSGPRVEATNRHVYRLTELDAKALGRARAAVVRALEGGRSMTRAELAVVLNRARIPCAGLRLACVVMHAELSGAICSGPRRGRQFTYALFDERAARGRSVSRDEALAELARRYFTGHGPATIRDFVWWSGLTVKDARAGLALNASTLVQDEVGGLTCWHDGGRFARLDRSPFVRLLQNYDEYFVAFKDRGWFDAARPARSSARDRSLFAHQLVIDGRPCGAWSRTWQAKGVHLDIRPFRALTARERKALDSEIQRYGAFLGFAATALVR